jgi:HTH-type transcriptional regulator/antitoxin HigA
MKNLKPIRNKIEYKAALAEASNFFDAEPKVGSKEADRFEILLMLIEAYEAKHYQISPPDPVEAIKFRMEQLGYTQTDLAKVVGLKSRASEILNKKRKLTLEMVRLIHKSMNEV